MTQDRIDTIFYKLSKLTQYLDKLKKYQKVSYGNFLKDSDVQDIVERNFHKASEIVLDIASMLIAEYRFRSPDDYHDTIIILGEEKILTADFANRFADVAKFRNILVHDYLSIDYQKVYHHLKNDLKDFDSFSQQISKFLS